METRYIKALGVLSGCLQKPPWVSTAKSCRFWRSFSTGNIGRCRRAVFRDTPAFELVPRTVPRSGPDRAPCRFPLQTGHWL